MPEASNRHRALIEKIFFDRHAPGATEFEFRREDLMAAAAALGIAQARNLGDVIYFI